MGRPKYTGKVCREQTKDAFPQSGRCGFGVLRLADARIMDQATAVLRDFLPRYDSRFARQPEHPEPTYRPAGRDLCLSETLCFNLGFAQNLEKI